MITKEGSLIALWLLFAIQKRLSSLPETTGLAGSAEEAGLRPGRRPPTSSSGGAAAHGSTHGPAAAPCTVGAAAGAEAEVGSILDCECNGNAAF